MESRFNELGSQVRDLEADARVVPLGMERKGPWLFNRNREEEWKFSFDKRVLYGNTTNQTTENLFQASSQLNTELHGQLLKQFLDAQFPGVEFDVEVKPKYKTFLSIPIKIPFVDFGWEKSPNKIRGDNNSDLASLPTRVTIKAKGNLASIDSNKLWQTVNQAACLHSKNEYIQERDNIKNIELIATDLSARASLNPFKRMANWLSGIVPRAFAKQWIPETVREIARVNPYGYPVAQRVLDYPVIGGGVSAHAANVGSSAAVLAAVGAAFYFGGKKAASDYSSGNSSNSASFGFVMGSNANSNPGFTQTLFATALSHNSSPGTFTNGYAHGVLFQRDLRMITAIPETLVNLAQPTANDGELHAPFATRDVIRNKK